MIRVLIIGAGFGGLTAAGEILKRVKSSFEVIVIDKKETSDFLPLLPDCIGRGINPDFLTFRIKDASRRMGFRFFQDEVVSVDLERKVVFAKNDSFEYDLLLIASGSETNFYGNQNVKDNALALDSVSDVKRLIAVLRQGGLKNFIIGGAGYTGIELATNVRVYLNKTSQDAKVIIVERAPNILGPLPEWMRRYVETNLETLKVDFFCGSTIEKIEGRRVYVSGGRIFDNALVIWSAGVKTADFIQDMEVEKNPQGRIKVDEYLRIRQDCFVIGDAALVAYQAGYLRMAVQFAIMQGRCAALNIINTQKKIPLRKFVPRDLGYVLPMANSNSCGMVFGVNLKGFLPTFLHFVMCIYRSYGLRNKLGLLRDLCKGKVA